MPDSSSVSLPYVDAGQQREAANLGMWIFLATEVMFFGALIAAYTIYRYQYAEAFASASGHADFWLGAINTAVLLISSLTMALAVQAAKAGERRSLTIFLLVTLGFGCVFLGLKGIEYAHHIGDHLLPGPGFTYDPRHAQGAEMFFYLYFVMTGVHALHMIAGILVLATLLALNGLGKFSESYHTPVELAGLYWHFVDVVWIFLFPMFYLIRGH